MNRIYSPAPSSRALFSENGGAEHTTSFQRYDRSTAGGSALEQSLIEKGTDPVTSMNPDRLKKKDLIILLKLARSKISFL